MAVLVFTGCQDTSIAESSTESTAESTEESTAPPAEDSPSTPAVTPEAVPNVDNSDTDLLGNWVFYDSIEEGGRALNFSMYLIFLPSQEVKYIYGQDSSDNIGVFLGTYTFENDKSLKLSFTKRYSFDSDFEKSDIDHGGKFSIELKDQKMMLSLQEGDPLSSSYPEGVPVELSLTNDLPGWVDAILTES